MTKEEIIVGLQKGRTLVIDRRDAPELPWVLELERKGKVTTELHQIDEQSSCLKVRWKNG
jgi:hypothetical protein